MSHGDQPNNIIICEWCRAVRMLGVELNGILRRIVSKASVGVLSKCVSADLRFVNLGHAMISQSDY
jgi:hypothetical protein